MTNWEQAILDEANKLILRFEAYARALADEDERRARRTVDVLPRRAPTRPGYWAADRGFDPFLVRASASRIAHSIQHAIRTRGYRPRNAILYSVPKAGGGLRDVSVFQVADNAVSRLIFRSLNETNGACLSSRAYAYRSHLSPQDAIQFITSDLKSTGRFFVAEYDFSKYFDNINHPAGASAALRRPNGRVRSASSSPAPTVTKWNDQIKPTSSDLRAWE